MLKNKKAVVFSFVFSVLVTLALFYADSVTAMPWNVWF